MSSPTTPSSTANPRPEPRAQRPEEDDRPLSGLRMLIEYLGAKSLGIVEHVGAIFLLCIEASGWVWKAAVDRKVRLGWRAIVTQIIRVGVRSVGIVSLVSGCVGLILAFQLSPPLDQFGNKELVANIIGVAVLRELGPLIAAIVLTGFAGASIAAEIGTMVVGEEIEALEAHALNPVKFLVVPRVMAAVLSMTCLAVISNVVSITAALLVSMLALDIPYSTYMSNTLDQVKLVDFWTGVVKGGIFGLLIGLIASYNGLRVTGGAAGVGQATTNTVVQSVVAVILADLLFTTVFYALRLF